eukprot:43859-Eustigmatos_ZCMA.PRE.1
MNDHGGDEGQGRIRPLTIHAIVRHAKLQRARCRRMLSRRRDVTSYLRVRDPFRVEPHVGVSNEASERIGRREALSDQRDLCVRVCVWYV